MATVAVLADRSTEHEKARSAALAFPQILSSPGLAPYERTNEEEVATISYGSLQCPNPSCRRASAADVHMRRSLVCPGSSARSFSPIRLLSAAWQLCRVLDRGFGLFVGAIVGYALSLGMLIVAALKVAFPARTGFWVGTHGIVWGVPPEGAVARELAGNWFIPISLWVAIFVGVATTFLVRAGVRRLRFGASYSEREGKCTRSPVS